MIIKSIEYSQYEDTENEWKLERFSLSPINLIVGENASGKTKLLNIIGNLGNLLVGTRSVFLSGSYRIEFQRSEDILTYTLRCNQGLVDEERLNIGRKNRLSRIRSGASKIYYERLKRKINFEPPPDQVVCLTRRDRVQHPFLEDLFEWGNTIRHYQFGTDMGKNAFTFPVEDSQKIPPAIAIRNTENVVATFIEGRKKFSDKFVSAIIQDMAKINYDITDVFVDQPFGLTGIPKAVLALHVKEADLKASTSQNEMSQGMFRAFSLIIYLNYSLLSEHPACILVDDIGEGLDFNRSRALIELLIDKTRKTSIQLLMASNDRFVMNNIPLEYWSVILRAGNVSKILNIQNSPKIFKEFELTGLSNFDFFSSQYYLKGEKS